MTRVQLAGIIRFHLGELAARNEFEQLCRYLARARVYSNNLPATGPVGADGDQGAISRPSRRESRIRPSLPSRTVHPMALLRSRRGR